MTVQVPVAIVGIVAVAASVGGYRSASQAVQPLTSTVSGVVLSAGDGQPLERAVVTLESQHPPLIRTALTNSDGRFLVSGLPVGQYVLVAEKNGYVTLPFGATRFNQPGSTVVVKAGTTVDALRILLPQTAAITGTVLLRDGRPAALAPVSVVQSVINPDDGERHFVPLVVPRAQSVASAAMTNSGGQFRLYGLPPGRYALRASAPSDPVEGTSFGYTYFPGTLNRIDAELIALQAGQELSVAITLQDRQRTTVTGRVRNRSLTTLRMTIGAGPFPNVGVTNIDGSFRFSHVTPGRYVLEARATALDGGLSQRLWGQAELLVNLGNASPVELDLFPGVKLSGQVVVVGGGAVDAAAVTTVAIQPLFPWRADPALTAEQDSVGRFLISDVPPGRYRFVATSKATAGEDERLRLDAVLIDGRDVADSPFSIRPGESISDVVIRFTSLTQGITGTFIRPDGGTGNPDPVVLIFSTDKAHWTPLSRRLQSARPATDGSFAFANMPAGTYYVATVEDPDPEDLKDRLFLETIAPDALRVTLLAGEQKALVLKAVR